jgi:hypothetical protein
MNTKLLSHTANRFTGGRWIEAPSHSMKEEYSLGGFNSILTIE